MAKKKETNNIEEIKKEVQEVVKIEEEEVAEETGRNWSEEIESAGNEVMGFFKNLWHEGKTRRVVVRNEADETVLNLPIVAGALGLFPPLTGPVITIAAVGTAAALLKKCKIAIERHAVEEGQEAV